MHAHVWLGVISPRCTFPGQNHFITFPNAVIGVLNSLMSTQSQLLSNLCVWITVLAHDSERGGEGRGGDKGREGT